MWLGMPVQTHTRVQHFPVLPSQRSSTLGSSAVRTLYQSNRSLAHFQMLHATVARAATTYAVGRPKYWWVTEDLGTTCPTATITHMYSSRKVIPGKHSINEKALRETQTLCAAHSKAEPKIFTPLQTPFRVMGWPKFNKLEMVTTFTYRPSLVNAISNYRGNRPTNTRRPPVANRQVR